MNLYSFIRKYDNTSSRFPYKDLSAHLSRLVRIFWAILSGRYNSKFHRIPLSPFSHLAPKIIRSTVYSKTKISLLSSATKFQDSFHP